jgi:hypothetical protein
MRKLTSQQRRRRRMGILRFVAEGGLFDDMDAPGYDVWRDMIYRELSALADELDRQWPEKKPAGRPAQTDKELISIWRMVKLEAFRVGGISEACRRLADSNGLDWKTLRQTYYRADRIMRAPAPQSLTPPKVPEQL